MSSPVPRGKHFKTEEVLHLKAPRDLERERRTVQAKKKYLKSFLGRVQCCIPAVQNEECTCQKLHKAPARRVGDCDLSSGEVCSLWDSLALFTH